MKYLHIRPRAPELFVAGEATQVRVLGLSSEDDEPPTERRPELAALWSARMNAWPEITKR